MSMLCYGLMGVEKLDTDTVQKFEVVSQKKE